MPPRVVISELSSIKGETKQRLLKERSEFLEHHNDYFLEYSTRQRKKRHLVLKHNGQSVNVTYNNQTVRVQCVRGFDHFGSGSGRSEGLRTTEHPAVLGDVTPSVFLKPIQKYRSKKNQTTPTAVVEAFTDPTQRDRGKALRTTPTMVEAFTDPTQRDRGKALRTTPTVVKAFINPIQRDRGKWRLRPTESTTKKVYTDPTQRPRQSRPKSRHRLPRSIKDNEECDSFKNVYGKEYYLGRASPTKRRSDDDVMENTVDGTPKEVIEELGVLLKEETVPIQATEVKDAMDRVDDLLFENRDDEIPGALLQKLDQLGTRFKLEEETGRVVRSNFAVLLADVNMTRVRGVRIAAGHDGDFTEDMFEFINDTSSLRLSSNETDALVLLPESVVKCPRRISFVAFRTDRAFRHDRSSNLNSRVLSVNVDGVYNFENGEVVEIHLNPFKRDIPRNQSRVCAYWHFSDNGTGHWSQEGCELTISKDGQLDVCRCNHLTHFAEILISRNVFSILDETILEMISVVGCSLSIFGITMIIITAIIFRSWRINDSNKVWLHLCSPVLLLNICFLLTVYVRFDQGDITCVILGVSLHYSVLATYCWMLVVAILSYRKLVLVFAKEIRNKLWISSIFSWGLPLLVIGILLAVDPRSYSGRYEEMTPNGSFCYPERVAFWVTVFAPIGVMWFVNWCLYGVIVKSMTESRKIRRHSNNKDDAMRSASVSCLLAFICGIPWVFGFFARNIVAAYLFTLTVSFQGFVLFLFFVVASKKTRDLWINLLSGVRNKYSGTSSGVRSRSRQKDSTRLQPDDASSPLTESRL